MSDGSSLRESWYKALDAAENRFRELLTSHPADWKRISSTTDSSPNKKGKARVSAVPELSDVVVHRNSKQSGDVIYRLVLEVPSGDDPVSLEPWKSVLTTPELRQEWDPAVTDAHLVEIIDHTSRISKTNFSLGWPANPRDAVTISRTLSDDTTVIDIGTSLPRSTDEPAYLRPSPPYVRSNVSLLAWCIQYIAPPQPPSPTEQPKRRNVSVPNSRIRITCFWQHDLRSVWNIGSNTAQQLSTMALGLFKTVLKRSSRIPKLVGYGNGVTIERVRFQLDREALTVDYAIVPEDEDYGKPSELDALREQKRLARSIECILPAEQGWDVQVSTKASSEELERLPWSGHAIYSTSYPLTAASPPNDQIVFRLSHAPLLDEHSVLKVKATIEISGPSSGLRLNGVPQTIQDGEERNPTSFTTPRMLPEVSSASLQTGSSLHTAASSSSSSATVLQQTMTERTPAAEKSILSRVKRNYIYFSSLLQEPEAKWKRNSEARGVTITQLDSIDPTLVVYRAEATFVGVGLWDLYGAVVSPGARNFWDKQHEDAVLLEDVNELTELWHFKTKPAWPVVGRDSVVLKTVYKSPTTIHVFAFSADDPHLFPNIPVAEPNVIRTQVDIQGWAIEALSPTTTLLTLLEQSDPKGWTNKTSIPTLMVNAVAGIGEFAIKCGGPPVVTRLAGAKANDYRYDHERSSFRVEYEPSVSRRSANGEIIECEVRCDVDTWAASLDIVVDPPPQSISCLRRHRVSSEGGGLWLTIVHDGVFLDDERVLVIVRKGPGKEKGVVMVNGAKVNVDVEDISENEIKTLSKMKRVKPVRIPLDQPPVESVIRKRRVEWAADESDAQITSDPTATSASSWTSPPKFSSPLGRFFTFAVDQATSSTQQAVAAMSPTASSSSLPSSSKSPMQYGLEALAWTQEIYDRNSTEGWTVTNEKGMSVRRKLFPELSPLIPVHAGEKVVEGVSAEELASIVTEYDCRKKWDDKFDSVNVLESFGGEARTCFLISKASFPFRDRGFYVSNVIARSQVGEGTRNAIFCVSASFSPDSVALFSPKKYNPYDLPIGRVFLDAWILETLDPYTKENYAIPSSRCTRLVAVDYAGSLPAAMNAMINSTLPRSILAVESYFRSISPLPITRLPAPGLVLTEKKDDDTVGELRWHLRRRDENRVLINTKFTPETASYKSLILVKLTFEAGSPSRQNQSQTTPKPSRILSQASITEETSNIDTTMSMPSPGSSPPSSSPVSTPTGTPRERSASSFSGRTSSAFTVKGEVRHTSDLVVGELVVDSRLYPDGYMLILKSRTKPKGSPILLNSTFGGEQSTLPLACTVHTMPSSPMHSSGMNSATPTRHLVRLTLPTARYQISTVQDPLTGETQHAPPKPGWFVEMEDGGGAVVEIEVRPAAVKSIDGVVFVDDGRSRGEGDEDYSPDVVVVSEKDALTALGREELLDDRISKTGVLSRTTASDSEPVPEAFKVPIAVSDGLLDSDIAVTQTVTDGKASLENDESSISSESSDDAPRALNLETIPPPSTSHSSTGGLLGFLQSYPNPLTRFSSSPGSVSAATTPCSEKVPGGLPEADVQAPMMRSNRRHTGGCPLSTTIIIALIAFLIGSLLRSLLSPADFIYVVTDLADAEEARNVNGWREMRRLFEIKYILGGWDFQLAVVRRH